MKLKRLTAAFIAIAMTLTLAVTASAKAETVTYDDTEIIKECASPSYTSSSTFTISNVVSQSTVLFDSATVDRFFTSDDTLRNYLEQSINKKIPVFNCVSTTDITYLNGLGKMGAPNGLLYISAVLELNGTLKSENISYKNKYWNYNNIYGFMMSSSGGEKPEISDSKEDGKQSLYAFGTTQTVSGTGSYLYIYQPMSPSVNPIPCLVFIVNLYDSEEAATKTTEKDESQKLSAPIVKSEVSKSGNIKLTWDKIDGADGYRVYLYDTNTSKYVKQAAVSGTQKTFKNTDKGTYKFKVVAITKNASGKYINQTASKACSVKVK